MYCAQPALTPSPTALASLLANSLKHRARRAPDFQIESRVLGALALALAKAPGSMLEEISRNALQYCNAHSVGISLLEEQGKPAVFQWRPLAGTRATAAANASRTRFLTAVATDTLLVPFYLDGVPAGVLWVAAHDVSRRFDREDARLLARLAEFVAAGCKALELQDNLGTEREAHVERRQAVELALVTDRNKDRFIAILAHELRGPLAPILMAARTLRLKLPVDAADARRIGEMIDRQALGMMRLIEELLDVSRMQDTEPVLRPGPQLLSQLVEHSVETTEPVVSAHSHVLHVSLPAEEIRLRGDGMRICQALQNLIYNAAKYTPPGGDIRVSVYRNGGEAVISVMDSGIGIPRARLGQIFELYEQAGQADTVLSEGGLGLGLYLARRLIKAHGGSIEARSDGAGLGSEFIIRLPCDVPDS
ncbi:MAG: HAMP domain-containing sensor histidine kinase [Steroidobacteraceae bacterium]